MSEKVRGPINLVEILAVILVVGIFVTLVIPKLGFERRMETKCHRNMLEIAKAESLFYADNNRYTDDYDDLKTYLDGIEKINFCPIDSATYVIKFKRDTIETPAGMPDSLMYELDFTDTTRSRYIQIDEQNYILQCLYGHGTIKSGAPDWEQR